MSSSSMYIIIHSCRYNKISFDPGWKLKVVGRLVGSLVSQSNK